MNPSHPSPSLRFVSEDDFESQVLQSKRPVLAAFWVPWSKPCHVIEPVLQEVAQTCAGQVAVVKIHADDYPALSLRYGVRYIPTLLYFEGGKLRGQLVGTVSKGALLNLLCPNHATVREEEIV